MPRPLCKSHDPEIWFPMPKDPIGEALAISLCGTCYLTEPCLDRALTTGEPEGIWGATTPETRRTLRRTATPARVYLLSIGVL